MAYDSSGTWKMEDDGVANRVAAITSGGSPLMKQARTQGMQAASRRGLGNSSMAIGAAQGAAYNAALPIASQEASQIAQKNVTQMGADADWRRTQYVTDADWKKTQYATDADMEKARAAIAADAQKTLVSSITDLTGQRYNALSNTLVNDKIPGAARNDVISSINAQNQQALDFLQRIYGVRFQPADAPAAGPPTTVPVVPPGTVYGLGTAGLGAGFARA